MKKFPVAVVLVLAAIGLVACGGSSDTDSTSGDTTAKQEAPPSVSETKFEAAPSGLAYTSKAASTTAGENVIVFTNLQSTKHNVALEDESGEIVEEGELVAKKSTSTTVEDLAAGEYTFFCTVPGHREGGMEGTLTVE
jgi:plastocyanin